MYTVEPRPKCPVSTHPEAQHHGRAIITVYKPNIVSVRLNATRCVQHLTHVHAYENILGCSRDAWRKSRTVKTTPAECRVWKRTLRACAEMRDSAIKENDDIDNMFYVSNPEECTFEKQFSQNNAATEYKTNPNLDYHYSLGDSNAYEKRTALLTNGFMEISMPSKTAVSPWSTIPKDRLMDGEYEFNNVTIVWDTKSVETLCPYVPRFRSEVTYVKYKHGDYNFPLDPADKSDERYTVFLVAEQYGAMFNVDSSQKILDTSKLECMPHASDYRTTVYQTAGDQIIVVTAVDDGADNAHDKSHIPDDLRHVGVDEQPHGSYAEIHCDSAEGKVKKAVGESEHSNYEPKKGDAGKVHDLETHYASVQKSSAPGFTKAAKAKYPEKTPEQVAALAAEGGGGASLQPHEQTQTEALAYALYKLQEKDRYNLHVRIVEGCIRRQIEWDLETQMMDQNPSRALSLRLNTAVEASIGGNGYYNVKRCELAYGIKVVPTLRTNADVMVSVNGKEYTVRDIVKRMGVKPDPEKCFAMPLVVFRSGITAEEVVGQLTLDGIIKIDKLAYIEACGRKKAFVYLVENTGHFFFHYERNFTAPISVIRNATERFLQASTPPPAPGTVVAPGLPEAKRAALQEEFRKHTILKIHTITLVEPTNIKEKQYKHFPTGLYSNNLYSVAEFQSVALGLMKLMEEQNYERFAIREFSKEFESDFGSSDSGIFSGAGNFLEGAGDFFLKVGEGGGALAYGIGGGVGQAFEGAGKGVEHVEKGFFSGLSDVFKGVTIPLIIIAVVIVVIAIVGVVVYKKIRGNDKPPRVHPQQQQQQHNHQTKGFQV